MRFDAALGFAEQSAGSGAASLVALTWPLHPRVGVEIAVGHARTSPRTVDPDDFGLDSKLTYRIERYAALGLRYEPVWEGRWQPFARAGWAYTNGVVEIDTFRVITVEELGGGVSTFLRDVLRRSSDDDSAYLAFGTQYPFERFDLTMQVQYLPSVGPVDSNRVDFLFGVSWGSK